MKDFKKLAQRHVLPLYKKDELGNYTFSSTMTFVKIKGNFFSIFAAHALNRNEDDLAAVGIFNTEGRFESLAKLSQEYKICRDLDLVAVRTTFGFPGKLYFDLDYVVDESRIQNKNFGWIGFPKKKALETIHKSKASEEDIKKYVIDDGGELPKFTNAQYLLIGVEYVSESEKNIIGKFSNTNVEYDIEGFKDNGYSPKGMSGGALFRVLSPPFNNINDLYYFAGIGLEYDGKRELVGASRQAVKSFLLEILGLEKNDK